MRIKKQRKKTRFYNIKELTPYIKYLAVMGTVCLFFLASYLVLSLIQLKFSIINQQIMSSDLAFLISIMTCSLGFLIYTVPILVLFLKLPRETNQQNLVDRTIKNKRSMGFYVFLLGAFSSLVSGIFHAVYIFSFSV
ncbi:MAG: hypothetical protein ACTSYV_02840 [Candidatus Heimdallarchaeaceae archaeon]